MLSRVVQFLEALRSGEQSTLYLFSFDKHCILRSFEGASLLYFLTLMLCHFPFLDHH